MADPLGLIGQTGGLGSAAGLQRPQSAPAGGVRPDPNAPSFKDLLMENIQQVNKLQAEATNAIDDLNAGKRADVEGVLLATQKADTAFKMLVSVRNKLTQAYEEIKQLRV